MHHSHQNKDLAELTSFAQALHANERQITLQSIYLVGELEQRRAAFTMGMSTEKFAQFIGLTINKYRNRIAAWWTVEFYPRAKELFELGEIDVCHLAMLFGKITDANQEIMLEGIRGTSKREAAAFIKRVLSNGDLIDEEEIVEITFRFTAREMEEFERAREILAHSGHVPTNAEIGLTAIRDLLYKRDPMKKAERAAARLDKKRREAESEAMGIPFSEKTVPGNEIFDEPNHPYHHHREAIPAAVSQVVWLRDEGKCTYEYHDGTLCGSRMMVELDHITMVCRGGKNVPENLQLRCRYHNQRQAELELGVQLATKYADRKA